jgi:hypothetical protein
MKNKTIQLTLLVSLGLMLAACTAVGETVQLGDQRHDYQTVELGALESPDIRIDMGAGKLLVSGGASQLMEADFIYNVAALEPEIEAGQNQLRILTPDTRVNFTSLFDLEDFRNEWDMRFNDDVAMQLDIRLGLGQANLDLGSLTLTRLDIDTGAGQLDLNLVGSPLENIILDAGVGDVRVDMSGAWSQDVNVNIDTGVGELTLILPQDTAVSVEVEGGIVDINADGFSRSNGRYTNDAQRGGAEIVIRIDAGIGEINLLLSN